MKNTKKYVKIQSSATIQVTAGLQYLDMTDAKAAIPNKMKVQALWSKSKIKIKQGTAWYPAYITEWNTIKALNKDGAITIGEFADTLPANITSEEAEEVSANEQALQHAKMEQERQMASNKKLKEIVLEDKAAV